MFVILEPKKTVENNVRDGIVDSTLSTSKLIPLGPGNSLTLQLWLCRCPGNQVCKLRNRSCALWKENLALLVAKAKVGIQPWLTSQCAKMGLLSNAHVNLNNIYCIVKRGKYIFLIT